MKNQKKALNVTLSLLLALMLTVMPAAAASAEGPQVTVEYSKETLNFSPTARKSYSAIDAKTIGIPTIFYDLRYTPVVNMVLPEVEPSETIYSTGYFMTNTTQIILKMTSDTFGYVRVSLMDRTTKKMLAQKSVYVDIWTTTLTFKNLTSDANYYFQYDNVGQTTVKMKGVVQGK